MTALMRPPRTLLHRTGALAFSERTLVMGVVNVTPDSFSDGGVHLDPEAALAGALRMAVEGADLLDLGAESTRPGHAPIPAEEEWARLEPVLARLRDRAMPPLSVDTSKAWVAERAVAAGASLINDVWGFRRDPDLGRVAAATGAAVILMHNREAVDAALDIAAELVDALSRSAETALRAGVAAERIVLDPGLGFGKTLDQNYQALAALPRLAALGFPVLVGASRKSMIARLFAPEPPPAERLPGTLGIHTAAVLNGARIVRAHDVAAHVQAMRVADRLLAAAQATSGGPG